jgi:hypothetical protein
MLEKALLLVNVNLRVGYGSKVILIRLRYEENVKKVTLKTLRKSR